MNKLCEILIGIPGSGKSTYRKKQVNEKNASYTNMDEIRIKLRESSNLSKKEFETEIKKVKFKKLEELFKYDTPYVIVDDTNLSQKTISQAVSLAKKYNYEVKYTFMETSFNVLKCHKNNMQRDHSEHIPVAVIENMAEMFYGVWFYFLTKDMLINKNRKKAIIVDIDGTSAHLTTRSPYDWSKVNEDKPDEIVRNIVNFYYNEGYEVLFVSGRDSICYEKTNTWLQMHNFNFHKLLMRDENDTRPDIIVKAEIYKNEIMQNYDISVVLDDRLQVVRFWRGIGLKTLQCQSGWF